MAPKTEHVCTQCGHTQAKWTGQCPDCKEWNSFEERQAVAASGSGKGISKGLAKGAANYSQPAQVASLGDHKAAEYPRFSTGSEEVDRVLGGGVVPGSVMLLAGEPGAGKSTIMSATCDYLAGNDKRVLYVAGEESGQQIRLRTDRLGLTNSSKIDLTSDCEVGAVCARIASGYDFVVIDSIQTLWDSELNGAPGSVSIVKSVGQALVRTAKESGCAVLIVGHVNKDGNLAGPRHLEHLVDGFLALEGERSEAYRILRAQKNRFGATDEIGVFEMTGKGLVGVSDPASIFLDEHSEHTPGSVVCPTLEGTRPMLIEVQALASPTHLPTPMRRARGIDKNRLDLLLAVLGQRSGWHLKLGTRDVYVNISGGIKIEEPALDLAACVAVASAATGRPVKKGLAIFGEVSLLGEVRAVQGGDRRANEAKRMGFNQVLAGPGQGTISVRTLKAALGAALEKERSDDIPDDQE